MEKVFINEFKEGMSIDGTFLCIHKALLKDKNGKPYLNLQLMDRTGNIETRVWDKAPQLMQHFDKLDYVQAKGNVVSYQEHLQLNLRDIHVIPEEKVCVEDFLPHSKKDIPQMYQDLLALCRQEIENPFVKKLILSILEDPQLAPAFQKAPAAKSNHHAWLGGLLEHVLQLCLVGRDVLKHYPKINKDLVLAGLILHDFGKVEELTTARSIEYTDKGRLVGHLIISVEIILKKAALIPDFPSKILHHIEHILLSHHGRLEYGSPKEPMTLEAIMVHHLDNMDSKLQGFMDLVDRESGGDPTWSSSGFVFKRPLYKKTLADMNSSIGKYPPTASSPAPEKKAAPAGDPPNSSPPKRPKKQENPSKKEKRPHSRQPLGTNLGELLSQQMKEGSKS